MDAEMIPTRTNDHGNAPAPPECTCPNTCCRRQRLGDPEGQPCVCAQDNPQLQAPSGPSECSDCSHRWPPPCVLAFFLGLVFFMTVSMISLLTTVFRAASPPPQPTYSETVKEVLPHE